MRISSPKYLFSASQKVTVTIFLAKIRLIDGSTSLSDNCSHKKFSDNNDLNFTLLSDPEHTTIEAYGAWGPRKFLGREYFGVHRNTYLIDPNGNIVKEYIGVNPQNHANEILKDLKEFKNKS